MATNVVFNGVTYSVPAEGDSGWAADLTAYFISIASNAFQKTGGTFTLTAEANFGATYGLKLPYIKSQATNPSATGIIRLGNTEGVSWRNAANSADLALTVSAGNLLQFNGTSVLMPGAGSIVNADINAAAAIALSKLAGLTASRALVSSAGGEISASSVTATELGYLSGVTSAIQTQMDLKAPLASPTFSGTITTAITASRALTTNGSSQLAASATTATELGYVNGVTSAIQTQLDGKVGAGGLLDGSSDTVQLTIQGHSTQTSDIFVVEKSDGTDLLQVTNTAGTKIRGTTTNDNAAAGYVGEYVENVNTGSPNNFPATNVIGGDQSIQLTAGDWDITAIMQININGATVSAAPQIFIGTASGDNVTGRLLGSNWAAADSTSPTNSASAWALVIPPWRVSISATTTYYLKCVASFTVATPTYRHRISARRIR